MQKTGGIISKCMTHAFNTRINRSVNRFRHLLCSLFRDKRDSAGAIFALTLYTFERSSKRINLTYACSIQYITKRKKKTVATPRTLHRQSIYYFQILWKRRRFKCQGFSWERKIKEKHRFMWQHAWKKRAFRHFRFAHVNLRSKNVWGSTFFDMYCITGKFTRSLFSRFSDIFRSFVVFFHSWIPVLMRKVRVH